MTCGRDKGGTGTYHIHDVAIISQLSCGVSSDSATEGMTGRNDFVARICCDSTLHGTENFVACLSPGSPESSFSLAVGTNVNGSQREFDVGNKI